MLSSFYATFPILCGIDVSYDTLPVNPALCFIPVQFSLRQSVPDVIQPLALRTSSPSLPRHLYHHHSLAHTFFFYSQYMSIPIQTTFLYFLGYFPTFAIPLVRSSLIQSTLVTPLIHFNTLISATYCDFFTAHVHWCLPGFSLLHTYPVLSLHNYLAVPSPYCASRLLDEALYRTPFLDIYTHHYVQSCFPLFLHTLPHREYCIRHPSTWHATKL